MIFCTDPTREVRRSFENFELYSGEIPLRIAFPARETHRFGAFEVMFETPFCVRTQKINFNTKNESKKLLEGGKNFFLQNIDPKLSNALFPMPISCLDKKWRNFD